MCALAGHIRQTSRDGYVLTDASKKISINLQPSDETGHP